MKVGMSDFYYGIIEASLAFCARLPFIVLSQSPFVVLGSGDGEFRREFSTAASARRYIARTRRHSPNADLRLYRHAGGRWQLMEAGGTAGGPVPLVAKRRARPATNRRLQIPPARAMLPTFKITIQPPKILGEPVPTQI